MKRDFPLATHWHDNSKDKTIPGISCQVKKRVTACLSVRHCQKSDMERARHHDHASKQRVILALTSCKIPWEISCMRMNRSCAIVSRAKACTASSYDSLARTFGDIEWQWLSAVTVLLKLLERIIVTAGTAVH